MESEEGRVERMAMRLARGLEERGLTASIRGGEVAVRAAGSAEAIQHALFQSLPWLPVSVDEGRLLLDIRTLPEEEISRVAREVAAEFHKAEGFIV